MDCCLKLMHPKFSTRFYIAYIRVRSTIDFWHKNSRTSLIFNSLINIVQFIIILYSLHYMSQQITVILSKMIESTIMTYFFSPIIIFILFFYKCFFSDGVKTKHLHAYVIRLNEARQSEIQRLKEIIEVFINIS